jgi:hypothetical protein
MVPNHRERSALFPTTNLLVTGYPFITASLKDKFRTNQALHIELHVGSHEYNVVESTENDKKTRKATQAHCNFSITN